MALFTTKNKSKFNLLVAEAVSVERQVRDAHEPMNRRLTAKAFLAAAIKNAATTEAKLADLRNKLTPETTPNVLAFIGRISRHLLPRCSEPPRSIARLHTYGTDLALPELPTGHTLMECVALAAEDLVKRKPDSFGAVEAMEAANEVLAGWMAKRRELFERIGKEYTHDDIDIGLADTQSRSVITLKVSCGAVPLAPTDTLGERLVNYILTKPDIAKALEGLR